MNLLYTVNEAFVPQLAASVASVCENKKFELTRGEQNDLLFHVIYLYCAKQSDSLDLTKSELELLEPPSSEDLRPVIELARSAYLDFGGNAQTAKSASFVSEIQKRASEQWGL